MAMKDKHSLVNDFAWYLSILLSLSRLVNSCGGKFADLIAEQLIEIALRVEIVRPYAVEIMMSILLDESILTTQQRDTMAPVRIGF